jgi:two-component sensor histidine kinase
MAIATTHQILSQHFDEAVSLKLMLENLIKNLKQMLVASAEITVDYEIPDEITLNSNHLVTISLIINELLSNAYEHAFKGRTTGHIKISASQVYHQVELVVKDDGIGYDVENVQTNLGLKIVSVYANEGLQGRLLTSSGSEGTENKIQFITGDK